MSRWRRGPCWPGPFPARSTTTGSGTPSAASTDYVYLPGPRLNSVPPDAVIVYENPAEMDGGINLLFPDGHVEFRDVRWAIDTIKRTEAWIDSRRT